MKKGGICNLRIYLIGYLERGIGIPEAAAAIVGHRYIIQPEGSQQELHLKMTKYAPGITIIPAHPVTPFFQFVCSSTEALLQGDSEVWYTPRNDRVYISLGCSCVHIPEQYRSDLNY